MWRYRPTAAWFNFHRPTAAWFNFHCRRLELIYNLNVIAACPNAKEKELVLPPACGPRHPAAARRLT